MLEGQSHIDRGPTVSESLLGDSDENFAVITRIDHSISSFTGHCTSAFAMGLVAYTSKMCLPCTVVHQEPKVEDDALVLSYCTANKGHIWWRYVTGKESHLMMQPSLPTQR